MNKIKSLNANINFKYKNNLTLNKLISTKNKIFNFQNYFYSNKIFKSSKEAVSDIKSNCRILIGGFGICGIPENLLRELSERHNEVNNLEIVSNNGGIADFGNGLLLKNKMVKRLTGSYVGENKILERMYLSGELELNLIPQGTLAEKCRAGGAGIPAFYTPTGYGTMIQEGGFPIRLDPNNLKNGKPLVESPKKPTAQFNGKNYVLEESITGDYALIKAYKADKEGNLIFRKTARNFNQDMATAAKLTIVEVEEIVEKGSIGPDEIHLPGIYVHRIVKGERFEKRLERKRDKAIEDNNQNGFESKQLDSKSKIAKRAAEELENGMYVNLGIGIPNLVTDYVPDSKSITFHSENGMLGLGPYPYGNEDPDLVSAIKEGVSETTGCSYFGSSTSFGMVRGKHIDVTILGALQVSQNGDLANWIIPGKLVKGMGGAMDLVGSGGKVIVTMEHTAKGDQIKILENCSLPLTGKRVVSKLITDLAVFEFDNEGILLKEIFKGVSMEDIKRLTGCKFRVCNNLRVLEY